MGTIKKIVSARKVLDKFYTGDVELALIAAQERIEDLECCLRHIAKKAQADRNGSISVEALSYEGDRTLKGFVEWALKEVD